MDLLRRVAQALSFWGETGKTSNTSGSERRASSNQERGKQASLSKAEKGEGEHNRTKEVRLDYKLREGKSLPDTRTAHRLNETLPDHSLHPSSSVKKADQTINTQATSSDNESANLPAQAMLEGFSRAPFTFNRGLYSTGLESTGNGIENDGEGIEPLSQTIAPVIEKDVQASTLETSHLRHVAPSIRSLNGKVTALYLTDAQISALTGENELANTLDKRTDNAEIQKTMGQPFGMMTAYELFTMADLDHGVPAARLRQHGLNIGEQKRCYLLSRNEAGSLLNDSLAGSELETQMEKFYDAHTSINRQNNSWQPVIHSNAPRTTTADETAAKKADDGRHSPEMNVVEQGDTPIADRLLSEQIEEEKESDSSEGAHPDESIDETAESRDDPRVHHDFGDYSNLSSNPQRSKGRSKSPRRTTGVNPGNDPSQYNFQSTIDPQVRAAESRDTPLEERTPQPEQPFIPVKMTEVKEGENTYSDSLIEGSFALELPTIETVDGTVAAFLAKRDLGKIYRTHAADGMRTRINQSNFASEVYQPHALVTKDGLATTPRTGHNDLVKKEFGKFVMLTPEEEHRNEEQPFQTLGLEKMQEYSHAFRRLYFNEIKKCAE